MKNLVLIFLLMNLWQGLMPANCGEAVYGHYETEMGWLIETVIRDGSYNVIVRIDGNTVRDGRYNVIARIDGNNVRDERYNVIARIDGNTVRDERYNVIARKDGVPQDYTQAVSWYRKAAEQGHEEAKKYMESLGL